MVTVSLINRWHKSPEKLESGKVKKLDNFDDYLIQIELSKVEDEIIVYFNQDSSQTIKNKLIMPVLADQSGNYLISLYSSTNQLIGHYRFEINPKFLLPESLVSALALFADSAESNLTPQIGEETLLKLPFFSPGIIKNSLDHSDNSEFEKLDCSIIENLPSLLKICHKPRRALKIEQQIIPIDKARRITHNSIEHLTSNPQLWQSRTATRITPNRIRSEVPEETLDIYENRVAVTLVKRLILYLEQRLHDVEQAYYQTETLHENLFTDYQYNRFREQRLRQLWQNSETIEDCLDQYEQAKELKAKINNLYIEVCQCLDSFLYRNLGNKASVNSPLKLTNILRMDSDYQRINILWEKLDLFQNSLSLSQQDLSKRYVQKDYTCYIHGCIILALQWIGFKQGYLKPDNFPSNLDFTQALQWEGWTLFVHSPSQDYFQIIIELFWQPLNNEQIKSDHPTHHRLIIIPIARSLIGDSDQVRKQIENLYNIEQIENILPRTTQKKSKQETVNHSIILVHPTDPRDRKISPDVAPKFIQQMLNIGENFASKKDYQNFVFTHQNSRSNINRLGMFLASPLDLNTLERFQRLFRFHTLGIDLLHGFHPSQCPVCNYDLKSSFSQFKSNEGTCPKCEAKWSWRNCNSCGGKIPKLEPLKMKPSTENLNSKSYAIHCMNREQLLGRDQLSALCESEEIPQSGRLREICPHCGNCTGTNETVSKCRRCNEVFLQVLIK